MKIAVDLTESDLKLVSEKLNGFAPHEVFDFHAHPYHPAHFQPNPPPWIADQPVLGCAQHRTALSRYLPGRTIHGLYFGLPKTQTDRGTINRWVANEVQKNGTRLSRALALVAPDDDRAAVAGMLRSGGFAGVKVYHVFASRHDTFNAAIEEYAPEWIWELCHEVNGVLMIHLVKDRAIADAENLTSLRRLCRAYPRCRLMLAHVARSFDYRNGLEGLAKLRDLDNAWVDMSAVTEADAMRAAIRALGPSRVLYGSDYAVSEMRGRCVTTGDSFFWLHPELIQPQHVPRTNFRMTLVGIESLLCLREACEECGLTAGDIQDIFLNNALRLLVSHLGVGTAPKELRGPELWRRAKGKISCGTGLLSKRAEIFDPASWPSYFSKCSGCEVWDMSGHRYTDFTGGVGAILLGYADREVTSAVRRRLDLGTYCTLVSPDEVELAELLLELHPWAQRVRFARGGGDAMGVAVRIARAATGRSGIAFCGYHGWQDWYLAANLGDSSSLDGHLLPGLQPLGVPRELQGTAVPFKYNDLISFEEAMKRLDGKLAAVVMEPMRAQTPAPGFLQEIARKCRAAGGVMVVDEITSGWRFGFPGACPSLGLDPDLVVYAKAMSNGFPCAAVVGREGVMDAANPSFISSSYWTDGVGPAAALACIRKMRRENVQAQVWKLGEQFQQGLERIAASHPRVGLKVGSRPCSPSLAFDLGPRSAAAKALMIRKMVARSYLISGQLYVMQAHDAAKVEAMLVHFDAVLGEIEGLIASGQLETEAGALTPATGFTRLA